MDTPAWVKPTSPSHTGSFSSLNEVPRLVGEFGVDWLAVSFPVARFDARQFHWVNQRRTTLLWENAKLVVTTVPNAGTYRARLEFNPSRLLGRREPMLCSIDEMNTVLQHLWSQLQSAVQPVGNFNSAQVQRLDLARHFTLQSPVATFLEGLRMVNPRYARTKDGYMSASGLFETLRVGNKNRLTKAYDLAQRHPTAKPNTLRWELQLRAAFLHRNGVNTVDDLAVDDAWRLALRMFDWSGMGSTFRLSGASLIEACRKFRTKDGEPWSDVRQRSFIGYFYMACHGVAADVSPATHAEYRRQMREHKLGLSLATLSSRNHAPAHRLDFWRGEEVIDDDDGGGLVAS